MIELKRFGIRADGNPVIETSTFIPVAPDHPLGVVLPGHDGFWVCIAVGNGLDQMQAREVSEIEYVNAKSQLEQLIAAREQETQMARDAAAEELEGKKEEVRQELIKLGLSETTISAIIAQVRQG